MRYLLLAVAIGAFGCASSSASGTQGSDELRGVGGSAGGSGGTKSSDSCVPKPAQEPLGTDPEQGHFFPDLQVATCSGERITLDELRCGHRLTLLSIGAGWCEPCREEAPELQHIFETLDAEGVQVVQVMFQDAEGNAATGLFCENWAETFELTLPVVIDPVGRSLEFFDAAVTPLNMLLDENGRVLWSMTGAVPENLEQTVRSFL